MLGFPAPDLQWCLTSALTIIHHRGLVAAAYRGTELPAAGKPLGLEKKKTPADAPLNQKYRHINSNAAAFFLSFSLFFFEVQLSKSGNTEGRRFGKKKKKKTCNRCPVLLCSASWLLAVNFDLTF